MLATAKQMPCAPLMIAVLIPITSADDDTSGSQQRQVGVGIDAEDAGLRDDTLDIPEPDLPRRSDHVAVGQHEAIRGDNDPGAQPAARSRARLF